MRALAIVLFVIGLVAVIFELAFGHRMLFGMEPAVTIIDYIEDYTFAVSMFAASCAASLLTRSESIRQT